MKFKIWQFSMRNNEYSFDIHPNFLIIFSTFFRTRREKGEPISSGYLSDHESKLHEMVQQYSLESQDSRLCYLTSSEVNINENFINFSPSNEMKYCNIL